MKKTKNLGLNKLISQMRILNPNEQIYPIELTPLNIKGILTLVNPSMLVYPDGYYWNPQDGVTNKYCTSGLYESFDIYYLHKV